jgi:hypothetical protein
MTDQQPAAIKLGDHVKLLGSGGLTGRVIEFRGPLGPKGAEVYRIRFRGRPKPAYVEVLAHQIEVLPAKENLAENAVDKP